MKQVLAIILCTLRELVRKKDFYVLFILMGVFLAFMGSQSYFGVQGPSLYVIDLGYSLAMFSSVIIAVVIAARQLPAEISSKTIYPLLAKPISRPMVIVSKFFGSFVASAVSFSFFFGVFLYFYLRSGVAESYMIVFQGYLLGIFLMGMVTALAVFFSNFLTLSANVTVSMLVYVMIVNFSEQIRSVFVFSRGVMSFVNGFVYYLLPHFEFYDIRVRVVHSWGDLPCSLVGSIALYTVLYCSALLILSGFLFKRREL